MSKESKLYNRYWRLNNLYKIIDKKSKSVVFRMNESQKEIYRQGKDNKRLMILKARQLGMTTEKLIMGLDTVLFYRNKTVVITAHKRDKQIEIFQKVKYAFENMVEQISYSGGVWNKPKTTYDNKNELFFKELNSKIMVTLDSRSGTPTDVHITEIAFRRDAREMMTGTLPSIPIDASLTIETTANGVGNYFYGLRNTYYGKTPKNNFDFKCVFIPRYTDKGYRIPLDDGENLDIPDKLKHLEKLDIDKEQIKRYLAQYKQLGREVFQENPSTPEEAFLTTGDTVRDLNLIKSLPVMEYKEDSIYRALRIYGDMEHETCMMGIDTSEGGENGDFSSISVRSSDGTLLACYYDHCPYDYLPKVVDRLHELGFNGVVCPEANNGGIATINAMKDYRWYSSLYTRKVIDSKTLKSSKKYGWMTTSSTRPVMLREYEAAIRLGEIDQIDERARPEMFGFVYSDKKKMEAVLGCHDDAIMSDAICRQMRKEQRILNG